MSSIVPGFEYDIFISYRQNDNRSGWVTEFVKHLTEELAATIKDPVSIYFDSNPHDGLLETHHVDKSLEGKLKSVIFIPIVSQTYCDPKSFAWQNEFCSFNALAQDDQLGRDVRLRSGNVASRILPVKIHDLDPEDKAVFEKEINAVLRAIEFIYREPGVNRPLKPSDNKTDNLNKTEYRNQVNKVANAIKDILTTLKNPQQVAATETRSPAQATATRTYTRPVAIVLGVLSLALLMYFIYPKFTKKEPELLDKSIAVLPFTDLSPARDQDYLADGIAEDIITQLSNINDLKVIGRTSSFQFKGEKIDLREVGEKLDVAVVLEGSVMKSGNKIRITAQLNNVRDGSQIWSERYDREFTDIFSVQDEIAKKIVDKMKVSIMYRDSGGKAKIPTSNLDAYEYCLRGQHLLNNGIQNARLAQPEFQQAIDMDPAYVDAWAGLALTYYLLPLINELTPNESVQKVEELTAKIIELDATNHTAHQLRFLAYYYYSHDWERAEAEYRKALEIRSEPTVGHAIFLHDVYQDNPAAINEMEEFLTRNPLNKDAIRLLGHLYTENKQFDAARNTLNKVIALDSLFGPAYCDLGFVDLYEQHYTEAFENFQTCDKLSPQWTGKSGMVIALMKSNKGIQARTIADQLIRSGTSAGTRVYLHFAMNETDLGFEWLEKAFQDGDPIIAQIRDLPTLFPIAHDPRYQEMVKRLNFPR